MRLFILIVIFIILSLIANFAFTGFTGPAQTSATKTMHAQTVKYISAEIQKCSLGETKFMGTNQNCPATAAKATTGAINTMTDKNTYDMTKNAIKSGTGFEVGYVNLSASGTTITIKTCTKTGCASADQMTATVSVE